MSDAQETKQIHEWFLHRGLPLVLTRRVRSRDLIATARGILMERLGIGSAEAFRELTMESHRTHRLVGDVAARIVASTTDA